MRAGLYARVSTTEQARGYSIDTQLETMRRYADTRGWEIVEYVDPGFSARTDDRPSFQEMMADAEAGRIDVVMLKSLDRGFRDVETQTRTLRWLREWEIAFVSVEEGFDDSSSNSRLNQNIKASVSQYQSDQLSEKTKAGKKARASKGLSNASQMPYGYQRGDDGAELDPAAAEAVGLAFEAYATGRHSDTTIAGLLNRKGYEPSGRARSGRWTREGVRYLLTNSYYAGQVQHSGDLYPGQHEAIVSQELFDQVQAVRAQKRWSAGGPRRPDRVYLLEGLAVCSRCGLELVSQTSLRPGRKPIAQYYCPSRRRSLPCDARPRLTRADRIDREIGELVRRVRLPDDWRDRLEELAEHREEKENIEGKRRYLQGKLRRLRDLYLEGDFTRGEYSRLKAELQGQLDALRPPERPAIEAAGETLETLGEVWAAAPKKLRAEILKTIFEEVRVDLSGRRLACVKPWPPFVPLFRMDGLSEKEGCFYVDEEGQEAGSAC